MKLKSVLVILLLSSPAMAVTTSTWTQTNQEDFKKGTLDNVVATNLGAVKLSRAVKTLLDQDPRISVVNALAEGPDGTIYAGTGPQGVLLAIKDGKVSTVATVDSATSLTSIVVEKSGRLLVGTTGQKGRILAIDKPGDKPHAIFDAEDVQYVWAMAQTPDGNLYAATGPSGKLFEIKPDGSNKVLLDSGESNLLSLVSDAGDLLYVGSNPHGLVYRVNRKTGESFVLYNAAESEVGALALDKQGNLFAATSEARDDQPNPAAAAAPAESQGRPEGGDTGVPIPSQSPKQPKPPESLPDPNPGEPNPIPKHTEKTFFHHGRLGTDLGHGIFLTADKHWVRTIAATPEELRRRKPQPAPAPAPNPGKPQPPVPPTITPAPDAAGAETPAHQPAVNTVNSGEPRPEGNAVYKIDRDGFVTEIFRQPVLVLAMAEHEGTLLIATGSEGEIYQVNPAAEETVVLAKTDAKQVTCLLPASDGNIYMGMANVGSIASMSSGYATRGTYVSAVMDATQISRFGKLQIHGSLPAGTSISIATRSGNVKEPVDQGWSKWSDEATAEEFLPIKSPSARFLQYRLTFNSKEGAGTPMVDDVAVAYQIPNLPPQVKSVHVAGTPDTSSSSATGQGGENDLRRVQPTPHQTITWEATDPNNDALQYTLSFRRLPAGPWIVLKDKLTETQFDFDTRSVADGRYVIKVLASDANANPPGEGKSASRVSDPIVVDNTPPAIGDLKWSQKGDSAKIDLKIVDETSTVAACDFSIDSSKDWQMVLPVDNIFDSPEETVSFLTPGLKPGQHQITLRATDARGNQAFQTIFVSIKGPVASK